VFQRVFAAVIEELNVGLVRRDIANHWACRCTVPGPGMRRAGEILVRRYRESGAAAELLAYPADDRTEFLGGHRNPLEWRPRDASLAVASPQKAAGVICRYGDEPLCLVSNSTGTPPGGVTAPLVLRCGPLGEADVAPGEWAGKLLFSDQPPGMVEAAARKAGAVGVISDCVSPPWLVQYPPVREPEDAPDLVMWTIFSGRRDQAPLFGFNLSPRQGRRLRRLIAEADEPVLLKAVVDAELVEGSSDLVQAVLPGTDRAAEELWVLAHLSEPGARDNASGCCLSVELARTLATLTTRGVLPPLRRTLRFLHATEVSGFLPYLEENSARLPQVLAGLCLDSVGQDFALCGGELLLFRAPEENPSFVDALMEKLLTAAAAEPAERFGNERYTMLPWRCERFWGNDAFVSDGFFDVPAPQLSGWPDRFYHSSQDTPDQMSDVTLGRVGAVTGTYLYLLATAGEREARWLGRLAASDWKRRILHAVENHLTDALANAPEPEAAARAASHVYHLGLQGQDAVTQAARFAPDHAPVEAELAAIAQEVRAFVEGEAQRLAAVLHPGQSRPELSPPPAAAVPGAELVARRLRWTPPPPEALSPATRERLAVLSRSGEGEIDLARIWAWVNGRRTARQIGERLCHGGVVPLASIVEYLRLMAAEGAVELREPGA